MPRGLSIHVVDVSRGVVAAGMAVDVLAGDPLTPLASGTIGDNGVLDCAALNAVLPAGRYQAVFHVAAFYRAAGIPLPAVPFLDVVTLDFGIDRSDQHYHLPMKVTPWGLSCFRGGA